MKNLQEFVGRLVMIAHERVDRGYRELFSAHAVLQMHEFSLVQTTDWIGPLTVLIYLIEGDKPVTPVRLADNLESITRTLALLRLISDELVLESKERAELSGTLLRLRGVMLDKQKKIVQYKITLEEVQSIDNSL